MLAAAFSVVATCASSSKCDHFAGEPRPRAEVSASATDAIALKSFRLSSTLFSVVGLVWKSLIDSTTGTKRVIEPMLRSTTNFTISSAAGAIFPSDLSTSPTTITGSICVSNTGIWSRLRGISIGWVPVCSTHSIFSSHSEDSTWRDRTRSSSFVSSSTLPISRRYMRMLSSVLSAVSIAWR